MSCKHANHKRYSLPRQFLPNIPGAKQEILVQKSFCSCTNYYKNFKSYVVEVKWRDV